jgi:hypothetical protein
LSPPATPPAAVVGLVEGVLVVDALVLGVLVVDGVLVAEVLGDALVDGVLDGVVLGLGALLRDAVEVPLAAGVPVPLPACPWPIWLTR